MNLSSCNWFPRWLLTTALAVGTLATCERAAAADAGAPSASSDTTAASAGDSGVVKPYTGPPVYLDEPPTVAPPVLVEHGNRSDKYADGQIRCERQVALFSDNHVEADGFYREYYPNGQLFVEGQYRRGRQQGEWTYYNDNGTLNRKVNYEKGLPDGQIEIRRPDGTLMAKRSFQNGRRTGEWIVYDDTGQQPRREEHYDDGKADGVWKSWFPSGQLQRQAGFKDGQRNGMSMEWNEDGTPRGELSFVEGALDGTATIWLPDGRKIVQQYKLGKLISESIQ